MDSEVQKSNQTKSRDYDKEPIVIEDYNPLFMALWTISWIPVKPHLGLSFVPYEILATCQENVWHVVENNQNYKPHTKAA